MLLENMALETLSPGHWKQLTKACLSGGDCLFWKTEFAEQCQATAERDQAQQAPIFHQMRVGEEPYAGSDQQLNFDIAAYSQMNAVAPKAWSTLQSSKEQTD